MIRKYYEVTCDYCGRGLNHYSNRKPTKAMLEADDIVCFATKHFCNHMCYVGWKHHHLL